MIEYVIRSFLGPALAQVLTFLQTHPEIVAIVVSIMLILYILGRMQLNNISKRTKEFVLGRYQDVIQRRPKITAGGLYKLIYPEWEKEVVKWAKFIPHKFDLWPMPVTAARAKEKLSFNVDWVKEVLKKNKLEILNDEEEPSNP